MENSKTTVIVILLLCMMLEGCASSPESVIDDITGARQGNADKILVQHADQLPRHEYKLTSGVIETVENEALFSSLAQKFKADILNDLSTYEISDHGTLKSQYVMIYRLSLLEGNYKQAAHYIELACQLSMKAASKMACGLQANALIKANTEVQEGIGSQKIVALSIRYRLDQMPFGVIRSEIRENKNSLEIWSKNLLYAALEESAKQFDKADAISKALASQIINIRYHVKAVAPYKDAILDEYSRYLKANKNDKSNIWAEREVNLTGRKNLNPVTVAIWDSGTDVSLFKNQLFVNRKEVYGNHKDDDQNGFIDDIHGIAYDLEGNKNNSLLYNIDSTQKYARYLRGKMDMFVGIESEDAKDLRKKLSSLKKAEFSPFLEGLMAYTLHIHGTHVAGIVVKGNPAAKILVARFEEATAILPPKPTIESARKHAEMYTESVEYFKQNGVNVVNMSWGNFYSQTENALEKHQVGESIEERRELARQIFNIHANALKKAIADAPDILFVAAAGNSNNDIDFAEGIPASFKLPNMITIGAVDKYGDEAVFTSYGKSVDAYACGVGVESMIPGGEILQMSGTSMSAPNGANLAVKLLAVKPGLSPSQLRKLMIDTSDEKTIGKVKIKLLNPLKALESVETKH